MSSHNSTAQLLFFISLYDTKVVAKDRALKVGGEKKEEFAKRLVFINFVSGAHGLGGLTP